MAKVLADDYATDGVADVRCPQNVQVTTGATFTCDATIDGDPVTIPITVTDDRGAYQVGGRPERAPGPPAWRRRAARRVRPVRRPLHSTAVDDARWARRRGSYTPGRTFGAFDPDGRLVGTTMSYRRARVPGGAVLPLAAVTARGVRADRTRRGLATA